MTDAQENYLKLLTRVKDIYKDYTHMYLEGTKLILQAKDRYGGFAGITLTEEQVVELGRDARDRLNAYRDDIACYVDDYDYLKKQESEGKEIPKPTK